MTRRELIKKMGLGCTALVLPVPKLAHADTNAPTGLTFGVIADVHQDIMHDGVDRLSAFVEEMDTQGVDFIVQLGDFCIPKKGNAPFVDTWRSFAGPRYHVLGNHEIDGGYSWEQVLEYYAMPSRYYSFDEGGIHFVVLDGNEKGGVSGGYPRYISQKQLEWLKSDLEQTDKPVVVFIHQPLDNPDGVDNRMEVRLVLEMVNRRAGWNKVFAVFAGHSHVDYARQLNGIYYVLINSASYQWLGQKYAHESYPVEIHERAPTIQYTCPYEKPLWATVDIDMSQGILHIIGKETQWVGPDPVALGADYENGYWAWNPRYSIPRISNWKAPLILQNGDLK